MQMPTKSYKNDAYYMENTNVIKQLKLRSERWVLGSNLNAPSNQRNDWKTT